MSRVIDPMEVISRFLQERTINPIEQEGRKPTVEELHNSIITAAATLLISVIDLGEGVILGSKHATGSNIKVVSKVASILDDAYKSADPVFDYPGAILRRQKELEDEEKATGIPIQPIL